MEHSVSPIADLYFIEFESLNEPLALVRYDIGGGTLFSVSFDNFMTEAAPEPSTGLLAPLGMIGSGKPDQGNHSKRSKKMPRQESAQRLLEEAADRDPERFRIGMLVADEQVIGVSMFLWFGSPDELLETAIAAEPSLAGLDDNLYASMVEELRRIRASHPSPLEGLDDQLRAKFNTVLAGITEIAWWGSLDDLLSKPSTEASEIRERFREDQEDPENPCKPIETVEKEAFLDFLRSYGH